MVKSYLFRSILTAAWFCAGSLFAQDLQTNNSLSQAGVGLGAQQAADADLPLAMDCGERRTIIQRRPPPVPVMEIDPSVATKADWAAYEKRVKDHFEQVSQAMEAQANGVVGPDAVEGCALDEWEVQEAVPANASPDDIEVILTGMTGAQAARAEERRETSASGNGAHTSSEQKVISAKATGNKPEKTALLDNIVVQVALTISLAAAVVFLARNLLLYPVGYFYRRRNCRIDAVLTTQHIQFEGHILILGKRGARFVPREHAVLDRVLDIPQLLEFSLSCAGVTKPVWVSKTNGTAVATIFTTKLSRADQETMLRQSTIPVTFGKWGLVIAERKQGARSVRERIAKLKQMREEELARKLVS